MSLKSRSSSRGIALVFCLWIIVLVAIIAVGVSNLIRIERTASASHFDRMQAVEFARMGVDTVAAAILKGTAVTNHPWATTPGQLYVGKDNASAPTELIPLSSGTISNLNPVPAVLAPPNLNVSTFADPSQHIVTEGLDPGTGTAVSMPLKWIYIRQDGGRDFSESPSLTDKSNPIVGRYAWWADDESSKINLNLAWTRTAVNTSLPGSPTRVNLSVLPGVTDALAAEIHGAVTTDAYTSAPRFFNSPEDVSRLSSDAATALLLNRFDITHFNHDPDTTFFNEPRIVLTTRNDIANPGLPAGDPAARPYLKILKDETKDPGDYLNIDDAKIAETIGKLRAYLQRVDWPLAPGSSFQEKYYSSYGGEKSERLTQIALNIIDYVRSRESNQLLVQQARGWLNGGNFTWGVAPGTTDPKYVFGGLTRAPHINELGVWMSSDMKELKFKVELFLPPGYGLTSVNPTDLYLFVGFVDAEGKTWRSKQEKILATECSSGVGGYFTITRTITNTTLGTVNNAESAPKLPFSSRPASLKIRALISNKASGQALDNVPLVASQAYLIECPIDPNTTTEDSIRSTEVDDPRVNRHKDDWHVRSSGNSFGTANSIRSVGQNPANVSPEQDTDAAGKITDYSLYMPPLKGSTDNPKGLVTSVAELGYIHTGLEGMAKAGTPWRTLHFQPSSLANSVVPDWAFMDLFTVPSETPNLSALQVFAPNQTFVGGRVNLNSKVEPFNMERTRPLEAVLLGAKRADGTTISATEAKELAGNIYHRLLATRGKVFGSPDIYDSPGEIAEIKGIADGGESGEELLRQISNQVTARGGVFGVYAIGQSLKQTADGRLIVLADQRVQTFLERVRDTSGTIKTRSIYNRRLTP